MPLSNYFGDLIKKETGKTAQEYIQCRIIELAKERILEGVQTVSQVAYELGFQYPQHFSRLFKKHVGCTPNEYKQKKLDVFFRYRSLNIMGDKVLKIGTVHQCNCCLGE